MMSLGANFTGLGEKLKIKKIYIYTYIYIQNLEALE